MSKLDQRFTTIYEKTREDLFAYIQRSMREEDTTLDILQDCFYNFMRIYRDRPMPDDTQCRMYLFRIARNLMINYGKKVYNRRVDLVESYDDRPLWRGSAADPTPEEQVLATMDAREKEDLLSELLGELKEDLRTAILLRYQSGMRLEEIAEILKVSVSTVSRLIQKGEQTLLQLGRARGLSLD